MPYKYTTITETDPNFNYTFSLHDLNSDTEYEIALVLAFRTYSDYTIPQANVKTNQATPEAVVVTSASCDDEK